MTEEASEAHRRGSTRRAENTEHAYRAALNRLTEGKATHPSLAGRPVRITPATVAREARRSRNPLYTTHRAILDEIAIVAEGSSAGANLADTVARLKAEMGELRAAARRHAEEKRRLASENLLLLHRAQVAEERLRDRDELHAAVDPCRSMLVS